MAPNSVELFHSVQKCDTQDNRQMTDHATEK